MSNWLSWLWCKSLVAWRIRDVSFLSHLWNLSFAIGWQPICRLFCKCLFNTSILNKISRMDNVLSSGELLAIATTMMGNMWSMVFLREFKGPSKGCHFFVPTYVCWFFFESQCLSVKMATPFVSIIMACSTCSFLQLTIYFLLCIMNLDFVLHCYTFIG
jgi:hypothetical protein